MTSLDPVSYYDARAAYHPFTNERVRFLHNCAVMSHRRTPAMDSCFSLWAVHLDQSARSFEPVYSALRTILFVWASALDKPRCRAMAEDLLTSMLRIGEIWHTIHTNPFNMNELNTFLWDLQPLLERILAMKLPLVMVSENAYDVYTHPDGNLKSFQYHLDRLVTALISLIQTVHSQKQEFNPHKCDKRMLGFIRDHGT